MKPLRIKRNHRGFDLIVGRWACRYSWGPGRFGNGSRWQSGWHDWTKEIDA